MEKEAAMIDVNAIIQHSCQKVKGKRLNTHLEQSVGFNLKISER
jgi:hypothetical protein